MEEAEVIDIDDLLGSSTAVEQQDAEEYDFENFPNDGEIPLRSDPTNLASTSQSPNSSTLQDGHNQRNVTSGSNHSKRRPRKASLEEDFNKLLLSPKSSTRKSREPEPGRGHKNNNNNDVAWQRVDPGESEGLSDAKVAQNEALVDSFVKGESTDVVLSDQELCIDVNSEELMRFILAFEASGEGNGDKPDDVSACDATKQSAAVNHVQSPSEDQESLNSSISTTESRDSSLTSSLASSDLSPVRTKQKVPRGKSVRFLMSNLLRNNKAQHHLTSRASGSEDDTKDVKRTTTKLKERSKKRDKEDRDRQRVAKQQARVLKTRVGSAPASGKDAAGAALRQQGDRVPDIRGQVSSVAVAMPLIPGAWDNTLHKQLIQAAARGDGQVLEFLLAANEGLSEVRDNRGNTLLHAVARRGHVDCLAWLAGGPCSGLLSVENEDCFTAAALAVKHGQLECVRCLAELPVSASELGTRDRRWSLLHLAARFGQEACLRWLLEHMHAQDISLDQADHSNNSPAHLAAKYGHLSCLQTLVEFNSDVTVLNKKKQSPCMVATRYHHHNCAQYLVVVETCIKLSNELTVSQRKLRESQQAKDLLAKKLREAVSCTDALVHTQKTDLAQRVEQIQAEYVDLTNLLVRQLDQMHRLPTDAGYQSGSTSREDLLVSKQKADQLEQVCSELLELDQRQQLEADRDQLQEIERRLSRLQPLPTSPIWPTPPAPLSTGQALDSMRARLSEVNQLISTLHHPGPSLTADNLDTLSLSSSYTSSLSSSSSSLQTGVVQPSPGHAAKKRKASWNEEPSPREVSVTEVEVAQPDTRTPSLGKACCATVNSGQPSERSRDAEGQRLSLGQSLDVETRENPSVQYVGGGITEPRKDGQNSSLPQFGVDVIRVQATAEYSEPLQQCRSRLSTVGTTHCEQSRSSGDSTVTSPPSYEQSCSKYSKESPRVESSIRAEVKKPDPLRQNTGVKPLRTDPARSQDEAVSAGREQQGSPVPYLLPTFDKPPPISDGHHQSSAVKPYSQAPKHFQQALPGFMRKVQPTNEFGEPEAAKVIVKISSREELVLVPAPAAGKTQGPSAHQRVGSNSSASSLSSDLPWSESDADESPRPVRPPPRGGILSKKSQTKRSQDKHITFALDNEEVKLCPAGPAASAKPPFTKCRDLSPIYEAPDLVKSTNDDSKKDTQKSDKREASSREADAKKLKESLSRDDSSPLGRRNLRLFSYSSDDGGHEGSGSCKLSKPSPRVERENSSLAKGLTDVVSLEFNGIDENGEVKSSCKDDETQEKLWYESSDDEDDPGDNLPFQADSSGGFERHICYL